MQAKQLSNAELSDLFFYEDLPDSSQQPRELKESSSAIGPWKNGIYFSLKTSPRTSTRLQPESALVQDEKKPLRIVCSNQQGLLSAKDDLLELKLNSRTKYMKQSQSERQPKVIIRNSKPSKLPNHSPVKLQSQIVSSKSPTVPITLTIASSDNHDTKNQIERQIVKRPQSANKHQTRLSPISNNSHGESLKDRPQQVVRVNATDQHQQSAAKKALFALTNRLSSSTGAVQDVQLRRVFIGLNESECKQISTLADQSRESSPNTTHTRKLALKHQPKRELFRATFRKKSTKTQREIFLPFGMISVPTKPDIKGPVAPISVNPPVELQRTDLHPPSKPLSQQSKELTAQKVGRSPQQVLHMRKKVYHDLTKHTSQLKTKKNNSLNIFQYL